MAAPSISAPVVHVAKPSAPQPPLPRPRFDRRIVALTMILSVSFTMLSSWVARSGRSPNAAWATGSSDHYSHWSSAILMWHRGLDVYRKPLYLTCPEVPAVGVYASVARGDVCNIPERVGMRPLVTNWRQFPRPYPPGWALYHAPVAWLHEHTTLSFVALNRLIIIQYLLFAHLLVGVLAAALLLRARGEPKTDAATMTLRLFFVVLAASETIRWTMLGYYDGVAVLASVLGVVGLARKRDLHAMGWLSLAMFLHFRALWLLPLLAVAVARAARNRELRSPITIAAGMMLSASAVAFFLVRPALRSFPLTNPVYYWRFDAINAECWNLVVPLAVAALVLLHARAWITFAVIAFQLLVITRTPQSQPWHALSLLPVVVLARFERMRSAEVAAGVIILVECRQIFEVAPLPGAWLAALFMP